MFSSQVYQNRRSKLVSLMKDGIILFLGNPESPMNYPANTFHYRQDSTFLYFFGLDFPGVAGILDAETGEEYLFGDDVDMEDIIWMGPQELFSIKAGRAGVRNTLKFNQLGGFISTAVAKGRKVHFLPPYRAENILLLSEMTGIASGNIKQNSSEKLIRAIVSLRSIKESCEIEEIEKACEVGYRMHVKAMEMARPGIWEQEIAGTIEGIAVSGGGLPAFPVILSQHGEILHNHNHSQILRKGSLMITDAGAETAMHYASDFTRTIPVGGKFTAQQREIYDIVLAANNKTTGMIAPGVSYLSIHLAVAELIASGLKAIGLMKGDVAEAVRCGAHALFFPHGLGHMMGLDVHDMEDLGQIYVGYDDEIRPSEQFGTAYLRLGRRLQEGFVLTNEPGIYFIPPLIEKWRAENIHSEFINFGKLEQYMEFGGIRIEDDLLVTGTGGRILGSRVPVEPDEIEAILSA